MRLSELLDAADLAELYIVTCDASMTVISSCGDSSALMNELLLSLSEAVLVLIVPNQ